jgi:sugar diacid utilization regulator
VIDFIDIVSTHVAEVYVEVEQLLLAHGERVRRDLLDDLLAGRLPPPGPRDEARRAASIEPDGTHVVLSALPGGADVDEHTLHAAAAALGRTGASATMPLSVLRGEEIVAIVPVSQTQAKALCEAVRVARVKLAEQGMVLTIAASTVVPGVEQLPAAYQEACNARSIAAKHGGVLCLCDLDAFDCLTLLGNETASRLIAPDIASFVSEDLSSGGVLTATLLEYAAADLNAKVAAERLYIHVNTAYHRLGRIAERTGRDLRSLGDVIDLMIAIKLAQARGSDFG